MKKLKINKRKKQNNHKVLSLGSTLVLFILLFGFNGTAQKKEIYVDRFYKTVDSIIECKKSFNFKDTISFISKALYSYRNNEVNFDFDTFLKCYEPTYENKLGVSEGIPTIEITSAYGRCDKKYILLFYVENYLLDMIPKKDSGLNHLNVYSTISLKHLKSGKLTVMGKVNDQKNLKDIYKKLLAIYNDKKLLNKLLYEKKISPLEYIGYKWEYN